MINGTSLVAKKAQIGATLTWFPAFIFIVFLMALFIIAAALFSSLKAVPDTSISAVNSKSVNLKFNPSEPEGYDSGDSALKRELISFLNSEVVLQGHGVYVKDLISNFDASVYGVGHRFSVEERKGNMDYNLFYDRAILFFNKTDECYVICLDFKKKGDKGNPSNRQVVVGEKCNSRDDSQYNCYVSYDYITSKIFNYAELNVSSKSAGYDFTRIRMLKGGISGMYDARQYG